MQLREELDSLEFWSRLNFRDAKHDRINFWILKLPVIISSSAVAVLAHSGPAIVVTIMAAIAAFCSLLDALRPRGMLFAAHSKAANQALDLYYDCKSTWNAESLRNQDQRTLAAEIIDNIRIKRHQISEALATVESAELGSQPAHNISSPPRHNRPKS
jgi:hypothetical protein